MTAKLKIQYRKTEELIPYARNARTHSDEQISQVAASIREFGFTNPILVDGEATIVAGHGRLLAAQRLGMVQVPTITLADMTEAQRRAYVITDNKLALNAGWDDELLALELGELKGFDFDLALIGFSLEEIQALCVMPDFEPGTKEDQGKLDELAPKMVTCPQCEKQFDLMEYE